MELKQQHNPLNRLAAHAKMLAVVARRRAETNCDMIGAAIVWTILAEDLARLQADCTPERMREAMEAARAS